jgi:hypothetical protein
MNIKLNWDAMGIATSLLCAIHCALLPLLTSSLPLFLNDKVVHNPYFEWSMIGLAFLIGYYSLSHGWKKHHHNKLPLVLFSTGVFFLAAKQFSAYHLPFLFIAVGLIISSHYMNFRLCNKSKCSDPHHKH